MKAVSVGADEHPSAAFRAAREHPVMVLNRHQPEAMLVHLDDESLLTEPGIRRALAIALYRDQSLSLRSGGSVLRTRNGRVHSAGGTARNSSGEGKCGHRTRGYRGDRRLAARLVAADASPLIGLAAAGAFDLLRKLHGLAVTGLTGVLLAAKSAVGEQRPSILRAPGTSNFRLSNEIADAVLEQAGEDG